MNEELRIIISAETARVRQACESASNDIRNLSEHSHHYGQKIGEAFKKAGKVALDATKTIAKGVGLATGAMVGLIGKAVNASGELEQNMGGSEQVFQHYAKNIQGYAKEAYSQMGLSTSEYLANANKMGALLQGSGFTIKESMDLTTQCMQRASDVASIMGIDVGSAMEAVTGAAKGNFTMMDNLGVAMNATTIEAYAMSKGIETSWKEMSNQEKEALALQMFLEKTEYAAGNYARENETLAGSLNTAKAAFTNFMDGSGDVDQFVTACTNAGQVILKNIVEIAPRIMQGVTDILNGLMPMIPQFVSELMPIALEGAVSLMNSLVDAVPQLVEILVSALPQLIQGLTLIIQGLIQSLEESIPMIIEAVVAVMPAIVEAIVETLPLMIELGIQTITAFLNGLTQALPTIIDAVKKLIPKIVKVFTQNIPTLLKAAVEFFMAIVEAIPEFLPDLIKELPKIIDEILNMLIENLPMILDAGVQLFMAIVEAIPEIIPALVEAIPDIIVSIVDAIIEAAPQILEAGVKMFMGLVEAIPKVIVELVKGIGTIIKTIKEKLVDKCKEIMKFDWKLPKLKLPHLNVSGRFSLVPPSVPHFSINWYARGGVFDSPSLFPYGNGSIGGLGENGAEAVVPLEKNTKWLDRLATMLSEKTGNGAPIVLQVDGKTFGEIAVDSINDLTRMNGSLPLRLI